MASADSKSNAARRVETYRDELHDPALFDDALSDDDRQILIDFDRKIKTLAGAQDRFGESYHASLMWYCRTFAIEVGGLATTLQDDTEGREAVDRILRWLKDEDLGDYTMESALSTLRVFGHLMLPYTNDKEFDEEELPQRFAKIEPGEYTKNKNPAPLPTEVIAYEEAILMALTCDKIRDRALIIFQWAAGLRPMCELHKLRWRHVEDKGDHFEITVPENAKTGSRSVYIYAGSAIFRQWYEQEHPAHLETEDGPRPETHIWTHYDENKPIRYRTLASVFERAANRAGIDDKPTSPQNFRRSQASFIARQPSSDERALRHQFGWSPFSQAPRHYIARFSDSHAIKIAYAHGHEVEDHEVDDPVSPISCERCDEWTTRGFEYCIWCSHPVGEEVQTITESIENPHKDGADLLDMIMNEEIGAEELRAAKMLEPVIKTRAGFWEDMDDLIELAERYQNDESQSAVAIGIGGAIAWMSAWVGRALHRWVQLQDSILRLHPETNYPPSRPTAGKIIGGWVLLALMSVVLLVWNGLAADVTAGEPVAVLGSMLGISIGGLLLRRSTPGLEDLREAFRTVE